MTGGRLGVLAMTILVAAAPPHAAPAPGADAAGNRMTAFAAATPLRAADGTPDPYVMRCSPDRHWCARMQQDASGHDWRIELGERAAAPMRMDVDPLDDETGFALWPHIVTEAGGAVLVGVEARRSTGYASGGASATRLILFRAEPGGSDLRQVLIVPLAAAKDIRACFGDRDRRHRRGACSDQYEFAGTLTLDPATRAGRPHFLYAARARTYPGRRTTESDSTTAPALRQSDLRWAVDPACTYRRRIAYDPRQQGYRPDTPLAACADYLDF